MNNPQSRITFRVALIIASLATTANAQTNRWIPILPGAGARTTAIAIDPDQPTTLFLGTDKGEVLRSDDRGNSWRSVHVEPGSFTVSAIALATAPGSAVYAVFTKSNFRDGTLVLRSRVLRSLDGGTTWDVATNGLRNLGIVVLLVDPFDSFRVYAVAQGGVFRSDDRGHTWTHVSNGLPDRNIQALVADPNVPGTLYAGAARAIPQSGGLFRTEDGGIHWTEISGSLLGPNQTILQVEALGAGSSPRNLYASVRRLAPGPGEPPSYSGESVLLRSSDGGNTWSTATLPQGAAVSLAVAPTSATTVYALDSALVWRSADGGITWTMVSGADVWPIAIDPNAPATIYAPSRQPTSLVARSENRGDSWIDLAIGLRSPIVLSVAAHANEVYAGTDRSIYKSTDRGTSWRTANVGLDDLRIARLDHVPWSQPVLFAVTDTHVIYRSTDRADTWVRASGGLPTGSGRSGEIAAFAADLTSFGTAYVSVVGFGGLYKTTDLGEHWTSLTNTLSFAVRGLETDPNGPGVVYATTPAGVFKSIDGGTTWAPSSQGLEGKLANLIAVDPSNSSVLYVTTSRFEPYPRGGEIEVSDVVYRSMDAGVSWTPLSSATYATTAIVVDPNSGAVYLFSFGGGVVRSLDRGVNWVGLNEGRPLVVSELALDGETPPTLYAAGGSPLEGVSSLSRVTLTTTPGFCEPTPTALCLNRGRFRVEASFNARHVRIDGDGVAIPLTDDAGGFWFFSAQNVETVVKVVDGTSFNDRFWTFLAGLSDVEYTITVTDTEADLVRTYFNPSGRLASLADAAAFPSGPLGHSTIETKRADSDRPNPTNALCQSGPSTLCLNDGRFNVTVEFHAPSIGQEGAATAVPWTTDTGYFWFFSPQNIELVVKVLDGRAVNGHFWVFYGTLTDLDTTITVVDTPTGNSRTYVNPAGSLTSAADTAAF